MTLLITGGSGFVGTNLCQALQADKEEFRIIDRRSSLTFPERTSVVDILDQDRLAQHITGDTIIHLAAEHRDDIRPISRYEEVNVQGTENICRVARMRDIRRIVFTSSVAVYGFAAPDTGEEGEINPFNEYGRTKFAAEEILRVWAAEDPENRSLTIIRPTVIFGPGNRGNVYNLFRQIATGRFLMVGDGNNRKSMAYIENIVAFLRCATKASPGVHLYNYVDKPDQTMNELVAHVRKIVRGKTGVGARLPYGVALTLGHIADGIARTTGKTLPLSAIRVRKFTATTAFASRASEMPGFLAKVSLADGIARTLEAEFLNPDPERPVYDTE